jgi:RNA polymerase sigma factor (sigma-70 family)
MFIILRSDVCVRPRGELCHTRDSGAVRIASLARRSAAFYFFDRFLTDKADIPARRLDLPGVSGTLCALDAPGEMPERWTPMANERHEWFLNQIFRHRAALYRYLRRFTSGAEDIEDLVQETYVRVYALSYTQAVESPRALLFRIAHNMAVERARRQRSQATDSVADLERLTVSSTEAPADEQIDASRRFESFCAAVDRLPPLCRRVFVLRKVYRLSHDEIAEVLGVSHSTIEKHVAKGLLRCRDYLREAGLLDTLEPTDRAQAPRRLRDFGDGE